MRFEDLCSAWKRAEHFTGSRRAPFTAYRSPMGNNYARMFYAEGGALGQLLMLDQWAKAINRACDARMVADDTDAKDAMAAFLSVCWVDPTKLRN